MTFDKVEVDLNNIKQNKYGKYEWSKYIGETINITCKGNVYVCEIKKYENKKYTLEYQDKDFIIELYKTKMKVRHISRMLRMNHSVVRKINNEHNNSV